MLVLTPGAMYAAFVLVVAVVTAAEMKPVPESTAAEPVLFPTVTVPEPVAEVVLLVLATTSVPLATVVPPEYVFVPDNVSVLLPLPVRVSALPVVT